MIIDADCHISSSHDDAIAMTADELLGLMDRAGVDRSLIWLKPPYDRDIERENAAVNAAAVAHPDRFIGFGWTNPRLGKDRARDAIRRCADDYGFAGIKFNGAQDDYVIDDPRVLELIEEAAQRGMIVAFHIGGDAPENTHASRLGRIAATFPDTQLLMVHMGGAAFPALERSALETAKLHPNIHVIASAIHERAVLQAIDLIGFERVSFGSDLPFFLNHTRLAMFKALLRDRPASEVEGVLGGNMVRLLRH